MKLDPKYLHIRCQPFDFENPPFDPIVFSQELVKTMYEQNGLGLAANQVGVPYQIFAMRGAPENFVIFNPRIIDLSTEEILLEEGCLSYPGLIVKIKRPSLIKVRFQTPNGETRTEKFVGMTARVFLHENDHLLGIRHYDRASRYHRDQAFKRVRKVKK